MTGSPVSGSVARAVAAPYADTATAHVTRARTRTSLFVLNIAIGRNLRSQPRTSLPGNCERVKVAPFRPTPSPCDERLAQLLGASAQRRKLESVQLRAE